MAAGDTSASEISSHLDIDVAIHRVYRGIMGGSFPNHLDAALIRDYHKEVKDRVENLLSDDSMDWANGSVRIFDLPKNDGLVRPISYMDVDIAVAYQALVDSASREIEKHIDALYTDRVLSFRLRNGSSPAMFQPSHEAYKRFVSIQHQQAEAGVFSYCLRMDIANYFERIYHHKLQQLMDRRGVPGVVTAAICGLLRKFSNGDSHGIPQGHWASNYLGNAYLLYLDDFLYTKDIYAVRYVDDYRIFCASEHEARTVRKECAGVLRDLGLNIQPQKTSIVTVDKLRPELKPITEKFSELKENTPWLVNNFYVFADWEEEEKGITDEDVAEFENLWTEAIDQEDKRSSILAFALSGMSETASPTAEEYILHNLGEFPHLASVSSKYLSSLGFNTDTGEVILDFIESNECIHEWQQMWLLKYFRDSSNDVRPFVERLKRLLNDFNRHPIVRSLIAEIIAFQGTDTDGEDIKRLFADESDPCVRRHLLLGFRLLPATERNYAIAYLPPNDWALRLAGRLVKSKAKLLDTD